MGFRGAASSRLQWQWACEQGLDGGALLAAADLTRAQLDADQVRDAQELALLEALVQACPRWAAGAEVGQRYGLADYGLWGLSLLASPTLADAVAVGLRFVALTYAFCGIEPRRLAGGLLVQVTAPEVPVTPALRRYLMLRELAAVWTLARELSPQEERLQLWMPEDWIMPVSGVLKWPVERCRVHAGPGVWLPREALMAPLPSCNADVWQRSQRLCAALLDEHRRQRGWAGRVRACLASEAVPDLALPEVARRLRVTERTLRRRLAAEGTGFRILQAQVREALGELWLAQGLQVEQVAARLGYSDSSNFIHAWRRWRGQPPGRSREGR